MDNSCVVNKTSFSKIKTEWVVFAVAFVMSLSLIFLHKPLQWYDEHTHFARAIQLSHGDFMVQGEKENIDIGGNINRGEYDFIIRAVFENTDKGFSLKWADTFNNIFRTSGDVFYAVTNTVTNHPIVYFPYIIAAWFAKVLDIAPVYEMYLMRLFGLFTFFGIYGCAIRKSKKARLPLSLFLLSPMVLLTFSSITADAYLYAISALFFVTLFEKMENILDDRSFQIKDCLEMFIVTILMAFCKMPSFLMIGLCLLLILYAFRKNRIKYKKFINVTMLSVTLAAIITLVFFFIVKDTNSGAYWGRNVDTAQQLSYIVQHPLKTLKLFVYSILNFSNFLVIQTGYVKNTISPFFSSVLFYCGILLSSKEKRTGNFINHERSAKYQLFDVYSYVAAACYIFMVFLMLYLQFSEIGSNTINGVQARYFVPVILLMMFIKIYHKQKISNNARLLSFVLVLTPIPFYILSQI